MKEFLKSFSPSVIFWNGLFFVTLIALAIFWLDAFLVVEFLASFVAFGVFLDSGMSGNNKNMWVYATPTFWLLFIIVMIVTGGDSLITKFNKRLNGKFEKK
jgi:hypothetical protein